MAYQYRIKVNDVTSQSLNEYPNEKWSVIGDTIEARGGKATLERRLITDSDILPMLTDTTGFITLKNNIVVCPWEIFAEIES